ncbi:hypothetical protein BgiMline_003030, partial [Biomphalaria glabrata]
MAEAPKQPRYIPSFLLKRGQKRNKAGKKQGPLRAAELKQADLVSKSVDSLLSVSSSISLPPEATLRKNPRSERHSLQSSSCGANGRSSSGQTRRHSYDVHAKEDYEFFDCEDGTSDLTSSSQEPSPLIRPKNVAGQSPDRVRSEPLRVQRQSTMSSLEASISLNSDWDSAESDIDEKNSLVLDEESLNKSDDNSSINSSPVITVHTCAVQ